MLSCSTVFDKSFQAHSASLAVVQVAESEEMHGDRQLQSIGKLLLRCKGVQEDLDDSEGASTGMGDEVSGSLGPS